MKVKILIVLGVFFSLIGTSQNSIDYQTAIQEVNEGVWQSMSLTSDQVWDVPISIMLEDRMSLAVHDEAVKSNPSFGKTVGVGALIGALSFIVITDQTGGSSIVPIWGIVLYGSVLGSVGGLIVYGIRKLSFINH